MLFDLQILWLKREVQSHLEFEVTACHTFAITTTAVLSRSKVGEKEKEEKDGYSR
jgi:hypothetical protein